MAKYPHTVKKNLSGNTSRKNFLRKEVDIPFLAKIPEKEVIDFTKNIAVMLKAKLPLVQALQTAENQVSNKRFINIIERVRKDLQKGNSLASSFSFHPELFDTMYVQLIKVGEASGILDEILLRLAGYREKAYKLKQRIRMALSYPAIIIFVAIVAVSFLMIFVVPTFIEMYRDFQAELPKPTLYILSISKFMTNNALVIFSLMLVFMLGIRYGFKTEKGRAVIDHILFKIPLFGQLYTKSIVSQFTKTLSTLLLSGITLSEALKILREASNNLILQQEVEMMISSIRKGKSFKQSLSDSVIFPEMVIQMISVGEETANLGEMLSQVADFYEEETDIMVAGLTSVIEPIIIIFIGLIIGIIIVALYLPIFELVNVIG